MLRRVAVVGASGVVGSAAVERFAAAGCEVVALSRRPPLLPDDVRFTPITLDLGDPAACAATVAALPSVSHLVYAAVAEAPGLIDGWSDPERIAMNAAMFDAVARPLAARGDLCWAGLLQGTKAYGAHLHPIALPAREDNPRDPHANFYWEQEDRLRALAARHGFAWTILRPQVVFGGAPGAAMNPVAAIGAYAAVCRELLLPFACPSPRGILWETTDAALLGDALVWAAEAQGAADQVFNITNGDIFVLRDAWPAIAETLGLEPAPARPLRLVDFLARPEVRAAWRRIARVNDLAEADLAALLGQSHHYVDLLLDPTVIEAGGLPSLVSGIKIRKAGFGECRDSLESLRFWLDRMAALRLLPPIRAMAHAA